MSLKREKGRNMNYVGIDIGSTASKVVVEGDKKEHFVLPTGWSSKETCEKIKNKLLEMGVDVTSDDTKVVATGYGRIAVDFADHVITEITCHARGAVWLHKKKDFINLEKLEKKNKTKEIYYYLKDMKRGKKA